MLRYTAGPSNPVWHWSFPTVRASMLSIALACRFCLGWLHMLFLTPNSLAVITALWQRVGWHSHPLRGGSQLLTEPWVKLPDTSSVLSTDTEDTSRIHPESGSGQRSCNTNPLLSQLRFLQISEWEDFHCFAHIQCFSERESYICISIIAFSPTVLHPYPRAFSLFFAAQLVTIYIVYLWRTGYG